MDMLHSLFVYFTETMATAARVEGGEVAGVLWIQVTGIEWGQK